MITRTPSGREPGDVGQCEVGAGRDAPGVIDRGRCGGEEAPGEVALPVREAVAQRDRLGGGDGHALPVDRVERTQGIAAHEQPRREPRALVAAARAGREGMRDDLIERLGGADRLGDIGRGDRGGERQPALGVGGRAVRRAVAAERRDPASVLLDEEEQRARQLRAGPDEHQPVAVERAGREPQMAGGVADVDRHALLDRPRVAERLEPRGHARTAAGRAHHQIRLQRLGRARIGAAQYADTGDPLPIGAGFEPEGVDAVAQLDVGERAHAAADVALQQRSARDQRAGPELGARERVPAEDDPHLVHRRIRRRARGDQLGDDARQQRLQARLTARQQRVGVRALRNPAASLDADRELVALDHGDALVRVGEHSRGQQPGHAGANHHCVFADPLHLATFRSSGDAQQDRRAR